MLHPEPLNSIKMKIVRTITTLALCMMLIVGVTSCLVVSTQHDNGKHKGWNKNSNNPHHPNSTNPGKGKGKKN
jgi:hypothetical protein